MARTADERLSEEAGAEIEFPRYLVLVAGGENVFLPIADARILLKKHGSEARFGDRVLEEGFILRHATEEEKGRVYNFA